MQCLPSRTEIRSIALHCKARNAPQCSHCPARLTRPGDPCMVLWLLAHALPNLIDPLQNSTWPGGQCRGLRGLQWTAERYRQFIFFAMIVWSCLHLISRERALTAGKCLLFSTAIMSRRNNVRGPTSALTEFLKVGTKF